MHAALCRDYSVLTVASFRTHMQLAMEEGDQVDVFIPQVGGSA